MKGIIWIAEIGQNFNGNLGKALDLIKRCSDAGATYTKFQLYDSFKIFKDAEPFFLDTLNAELTKNQALFLGKFCSKGKSMYLASPFDELKLGWIAEVYQRWYPDLALWPVKIASRAAMEEHLLWSLKQIGASSFFRAWFGFISHGMETFPRKLYDKYFQTHYHLWCKAQYPAIFTSEDWTNLELGLKNGEFVGFSDHTIGTEAIDKAVSWGAKVIEKHITFDKAAPGPDHSLSITPEELADLIQKHGGKRYEGGASPPKPDI